MAQNQLLCQTPQENEVILVNLVTTLLHIYCLIKLIILMGKFPSILAFTLSVVTDAPSANSHFKLCQSVAILKEYYLPSK